MELQNISFKNWSPKAVLMHCGVENLNYWYEDLCKNKALFKDALGALNLK